MVEKCLGVNKDGSACQAKPRPDSTHCPWHTEAMAEQRRAWSRKGGTARSNKARARRQIGADALSMPEVAGLLSLALRGVLSGRIEPGVGNAAASLARALTQVHEVSELEDRIAALGQAAQRSTA